MHTYTIQTSTHFAEFDVSDDEIDLWHKVVVAEDEQRVFNSSRV